MSNLNSQPKLDNCPSCNQATYHANYVLTEEMRYERAICRHCRKHFIRITWYELGEILQNTYELAKERR